MVTIQLGDAPPFAVSVRGQYIDDLAEALRQATASAFPAATRSTATGCSECIRTSGG